MDAPGASRLRARADACLRDLAEVGPGPVVAFSDRHFSRLLAARALGPAPEAGRIFGTATAAVSVVAEYRGEPCITLWNASVEFDCGHRPPRGRR